MKVSILIITYNHEKFIEQAINSALLQETNFDYEIIIGEDCSLDRTRQTVLEFYRRHPDKIRLSLRETNVGIHNNFLQTLSESKGEYIALLEGDDYWTSPFKLQKQVELLENNPELSMCFHDIKVFHEDGNAEFHDSSYYGYVQNEIASVDDLWKGCGIASCSAMLKRELLENLPNWFKTIHCPDWALFILYAEKGKIGYINEIMAAYRIHDGGVWSGLSDIQQIEVVIDFYNSMNTNLNFIYTKTIKKMISKQYYQLAVAHEKNGNIDKAKTCLLKSFTEAPFNKSIPFRNLVKLGSQLYFRPRSRSKS